MNRPFDVISPVDGSVVTTVPLATPGQIARTLDQAQKAQKAWREESVAARASVVEAFVQAIEGRSKEYAELLTRQMGRPISYTPGELRGMAERARYMASIAEESLADIQAPPQPGFRRFVRRDPLGVVLVLAPWNYPYLTAVNAVVPSLLAGNSVILKHSDQTPLVADHFKDAFESAGLPEGVFQVLHMTHDATAQVVEDDCIDHVAFTGSVEGGRAVLRAAASRAARNDFITVGLELGGKDPAYVRSDADLDHAVPNVVEGALFNSGQSCCAIERVYVHRDIAAEFIRRATENALTYRLGNPMESSTTLGPVVRQRNADMIRAQVTAAIEAGARPALDAGRYPMDRPDTPYLAPQILTDVTHTMDIMTEETFGPVMGVMVVDDDDEAVKRMNDSKFGLTASIWTQDADISMGLASRLEAGTVFMNRCDYLDPALAWTGVKQSGRGTTLSSVGFEHVTRPKSYHLRTDI